VTLPMFATRRADDSLLLTIGNAIEPVECPELEDSVTATTAVYTGCLEAAIRRYPDQWNWLGLARDGRVSRAEMARRKAARHGAGKRGHGPAHQGKTSSESTADSNKEIQREIPIRKGVEI